METLHQLLEIPIPSIRFTYCGQSITTAGNGLYTVSKQNSLGGWGLFLLFKVMNLFTICYCYYITARVRLQTVRSV